VFGPSTPSSIPNTTFSHSTPCSTIAYSQRTATTSIFENAGVHASAPFPLGEIGSSTSSAASKSTSFGFSETKKTLEQAKDSKSLLSKPDARKASGKENSTVCMTSSVVSTKNNSIPFGTPGDTRKTLSFSGIGSRGSDESAFPSSSCSPGMKKLEEAKDSILSREADATKASLPIARSPEIPQLALVKDYQSFRAAHYAFDPLTLPLHVYIMSELSQLPVVASSKAGTSDGSTAPPFDVSLSGSVLVFGASSSATTPFSQQPPFSTNNISQRIATSRGDAEESSLSAVNALGGSFSRAGTAASVPLGEIGSGTSSAASKSASFGFSETKKTLEQAKDSNSLLSKPDARKASGKENATVCMTSSVVSTKNNSIPFAAPGDTRKTLSFSGIGSRSSAESTFSSSSCSPGMKNLEEAKDSILSSEADATKASARIARSPEIPQLALVEDYQSFRAAHYVFDPLTLPLHVYIMSELSQLPVVASSKVDASVGLTEANSDDGLSTLNTSEATGSEERPWTPYNRRSIPVGHSFTGSNPVNAIDNTETRKMNPGQESRTLRRGLLVDSLSIALLQEVSHILEQERRVNSENSVRVASRATNTRDETKQGNPDDGLRNKDTGGESIGQLNYCCCEW
jgi:hypothetical protein